MRRMTYLLSFLALALLLSSNGCSQQTTESIPGGAASSNGGDEVSEKPAAVIGVSILTTTNPFFVQLAAAMDEEAKKHNFRLIHTSADTKVATQTDQINEFITQQVDAIVLCPCDSKLMGPAIMKANEVGIPVFTADIANLHEQAKVACHVATDNYGGGKLAGETIAELLGGNGKVAILDYPEVESVLLRTQGFHEVVDKLPGIEIVGTWPCGGDEVMSFNAAQEVLQAHDDLDAFFAINDPTGIGAATALEKAGKADRIEIVSFDAQPIGREAVKQGRIHATIVQYPEQIGQKAIEAVARYMNAEDVEKELLIPCTVYRKADADVDPTLEGK